jgi:LmbE family N-acetylglucosaminyl deacetylase
MLKLAFDRAPRSILFIGAHCDDIEIGCGGTILTLVEQFPQAHIDWVILSSSPVRSKEAEAAAKCFLQGAGSSHVHIRDFRNGYFPYVGGEIKDYFESLKRQINPDLIFTHHVDDRHQDHRTASELTWNTFRNHLILEYEIPKYDGGLGSPNLFVPASEKTANAKIAALMQYFPSEARKSWFTPETFHALLRLRGVESNSPTGFAEGFFCRKVSL